MPKIYEYLFKNTLPKGKQPGDVLYINEDSEAVWIALEDLHDIPVFKKSYIVENSTQRISLPNVVKESYCYETSTGNTYIFDGEEWLPIVKASWGDVPIVLSPTEPVDAKLWFELI